MSKEKAVILLSGGLDSAVSLAKASVEFDVCLALFFNYGQKAYEYEKVAAEKLSSYYNVELKIIDLPWLKSITSTSLVNGDTDIPALSVNDLDDDDASFQSMRNVWIPNRNAVFVNIAAAFCDSVGYKKIIIGANKEEAATFEDNSIDFIEKSNAVLKYSTLVKPEIIAPLINLEKEGIIKLGYELNLPFENIYSCYLGKERHCGRCESCQRLKRGLERLGLFDIVSVLFVE